MTLLAWIVAAAIMAEYAIDALASWLTLRTLADPVPAGFEGFYSAEQYRRTQQYTLQRTVLGFVHSTFDLAVLLAFWRAGGFQRVDDVAGSFGWHPLLAGGAYIAILILLRGILALPFSLYSTFVLEARFGFNTMTLRTFLLDRLKALLLGAGLGGPLLIGILAFFSFAGPSAWLYCWGTVTVIALALQYIGPAWIMPLFNKFTPLDGGALRDAIFAYARSVGFTVENVLVMDGSRRSTKANAFFTGFGKHKRIALFDTLLRDHPGDELVAVLAHEIGHYKRRHILQGTAIGIAHMGVMFALLSLAISERPLFDAFLLERTSVHAGLIVFGILFSPAEFLLGIGMNALARRNEFQADRWAAETTGTGVHLIAALKRLSARNLSHLTPHPLDVFLHYSHPPVPQRVAALGALSPSSTVES